MPTGFCRFVSALGLVGLMAASSHAGQAAQGRVIPDANQHILPERERPPVINKILRDRLDNLSRA